MIKPIHNESDYKIALERVDYLWEAKQDTPEGDELANQARRSNFRHSYSYAFCQIEI